MSEFEDLVLEYEGGFPGSGPNWAAYKKMIERGKYLEAENARLREAPAIRRLDESLRVIFALVNKLGGEVSLTYDELKGIEGMNLTTRNDDAEMVFVLKVSSRR